MENLERDEIGHNLCIATSVSAGNSVGFGGRRRGDFGPEIFESWSLSRSRIRSGRVDGSAETPVSSSNWKNYQSGSHRSKIPMEKMPCRSCTNTSVSHINPNSLSKLVSSEPNAENIERIQK